jgi:hypothetical protein
MRIGAKGKYTKMNRRKPRGLGTCDYSGLIMRHADMIKQNQFRGNGLVWTGFWVNPKFADKPNPQELVPIIRLDPIPLQHARPDPTVYDTTITTLNLDVSGGSNITLSNEQFNNMVLNFSGILTNNIVIYFNDIYNQFYANNLTTGGYTLGMQVVGRSNPPLIIPPADPITRTGPQVVNNLVELQFVWY